MEMLSHGTENKISGADIDPPAAGPAGRQDASFEQRRDTNKYISGRIQPLYNPSTGLNNIINNSINYIFLRYRCFVIHVALPRAKKQKQEPPKPSYHDVTLPQKQPQQHRPNLSHHMSAKKEKHVRHAATWFAGVSAYAPGDAQ
jgi:hypothetical protein